MRVAFLLLLILHAIIHLLWFAHSLGWIELDYFRKEIPGMVGFSWLLAAIFFLWAAVLLGRRKPNWFHPALIGVLISQMWIFSAWEDTKFGSLANLLVLFGTLIGFAKWEFEARFRQDARALFDNFVPSNRTLTEEHLKALPEVLAGYIKKSGAVGKPVPENVHLVFAGQMRQRGKPWFSFTSEQYNFIPRPARLFFMKGRIRGLSVWGYHSYHPPTAKMTIRALSLLPQLKIEGPEMYPTETVTFLNDLCLFAPGALADERIQWEELDDLSIRARLVLKELEVSAILYFNREGDLVNFRSEDRYDVDKMERFPFTTPVKDYREFNGMRLPSYGEAVWHYPEGEFAYGKFRLKSASYNTPEVPS
jgi:hypothetical protein